MNAKDKARWVKALRSGKYPQTTNVLKRTEPGVEDDEPVGYCCLGVLREVCPEFTASNELDVYLKHTEALPYEVQRHFGRMNDVGVPFEMIAGLIHYAL